MCVVFESLSLSLSLFWFMAFFLVVVVQWKNWIFQTNKKLLWFSSQVQYRSIFVVFGDKIHFIYLLFDLIIIINLSPYIMMMNNQIIIIGDTFILLLSFFFSFNFHNDRWLYDDGGGGSSGMYDDYHHHSNS